MRKISFLMISFWGLSFSASYSMDMIAYVRTVERWQQEGRYPELTRLQKDVDAARVELDKSEQAAERGSKGEQLKRVNDALWEAQLQEAKKLYVEEISRLTK